VFSKLAPHSPRLERTVFQIIDLCFYLEANDIPSQPALLLVLKWGGQLTQTGKNQAEALGKVKKAIIFILIYRI